MLYLRIESVRERERWSVGLNTECEWISFIDPGSSLSNIHRCGLDDDMYSEHGHWIGRRTLDWLDGIGLVGHHLIDWTA